MSEERKGQWSYAAHELDERWQGQCETREEAIAEGAAELGIEPGEDFWIDTCTERAPSEFAPDAAGLIEVAANNAYDECGDVAEGWPDVTDEAKAELDAFLGAWFAKHAPIRFWTMDGKPERVTAPRPADAQPHGREATPTTEGER